MSHKVQANTFTIRGNRISQKKKTEVTKRTKCLKRKDNMGKNKKEKRNLINQQTNISILIINLNVNDLKTPVKRQKLLNWMKIKTRPNYFLCTENSQEA